MWRGLVSAGLCACCFQILNYSVVSHCSPQLFLPSDPQSRNRQRIHPHVHACIQCRLVCYVLSCILSSMLWNTQGIPFVHLFLLSGSLSWLVFDKGTLAGRCRKPSFDVPCVAWSHEVEGELLPESDLVHICCYNTILGLQHHVQGQVLGQLCPGRSGFKLIC